MAGAAARYGLVCCIAALTLAACGGGGTSAPAALTTPTTAQQVGGDATALEDQFISVISRVSQSVVAIQTGSGLGSGVIVARQHHHERPCKGRLF